MLLAASAPPWPRERMRADRFVRVVDVSGSRSGKRIFRAFQTGPLAKQKPSLAASLFLRSHMTSDPTWRLLRNASSACSPTLFQCGRSISQVHPCFHNQTHLSSTCYQFKALRNASVLNHVPYTRPPSLLPIIRTSTSTHRPNKMPDLHPDMRRLSNDVSYRSQV
jgi:hypothetical protein